MVTVPCGRLGFWTMLCTALVCCALARTVGVGGSTAADNRKGWAEMRREKLQVSRTVPASEGPFLVPVLRYGPNNQLLQFIHSMAIARYTGSAIIPPEFGGHFLERTAGARRRGHSLEEIVDVEVLLAGVRLLSTGRLPSASAADNATSKVGAPPNTTADSGLNNRSSTFLAVAPAGYDAAATRWLFPTETSQSAFLNDQAERIRKYDAPNLFTYGLWSAQSALDLSPAGAATCSVVGPFRGLQTRTDVLTRMDEYSAEIGKVHANHGVALMPMTLGQSPFGGLAIESPASFYQAFIKNNLWARVNLEMMNYYAPPERIRKLAAQASRSEVLDAGKYIAVHVRVSDDCDPALDLLHKCFVPGGNPADEVQLWEALARHALESNATKIFIAIPAKMKAIFLPELWPETAVTSDDLSEATGLSNWDLSIFEQAVASNSKAFVYTGRSRQGKKVTSLLTGKQRHKVSGETEAKHQLPPNTSTWAIVVLLVRMTLQHRNRRDSLAADITLERLLDSMHGGGGDSRADQGLAGTAVPGAALPTIAVVSEGG